MNNTPNSCIGKTVKINNEDLDLLCFFYPGFILKENLLFDKQKSIIYTGKHRKDLINYLKNNTKQFINTVGKADINFTNKKELIRFVYNKRGKNYNNYLISDYINFLVNLDRVEFNNFIKIYWVLGYSNLEVYNDKIEVQELFISLNKDFKILLEKYFKLIEKYNASYIETCLINFIEIVVFNKRYINSNKELKESYISFRKSFSNKYIVNVLSKYRQIKYSKKVKLIWLLKQFSNINYVEEKTNVNK